MWNKMHRENRFLFQINICIAVREENFKPVVRTFRRRMFFFYAGFYVELFSAKSLLKPVNIMPEEYFFAYAFFPVVNIFIKYNLFE